MWKQGFHSQSDDLSQEHLMDNQRSRIFCRNTVMIFFVAMRNIIIKNYKLCTWKLSQNSYNRICELKSLNSHRNRSDLIAASRLFKPGSYQLSLCCTFIIIQFYSTTSFSEDLIVW
ncbi:unnamed protein product [Schistosoma spindalis]|nr:unnamed protein product [Schistosoma spindale]